MKLSKRGEYALRALLALTYAYNSNALSSNQLKLLSEKEDIPYKFLEQIMSALKHGGLVKSQKGKVVHFSLLLTFNFLSFNFSL